MKKVLVMALILSLFSPIFSFAHCDSDHSDYSCEITYSTIVSWGLFGTHLLPSFNIFYEDDDGRIFQGSYANPWLAKQNLCRRLGRCGRHLKCHENY